MKQVNKYRKEINYEINSKIFLNERNIMTARSFKKLNNKMLNSFNMLDFVDFSYRLKLSETMHIRNVSHSELFHLVVNDLLPDQNNDSSESIIINDENE
jgi:histidinol phosphatase-like enzyme